MAKEGKPKPNCEGYGVAYSGTDDECLKCDISSDCERLTNGDDLDAGAKTDKEEFPVASKKEEKAKATAKKDEDAPAKAESKSDIISRLDAIKARIEDIASAMISTGNVGGGKKKGSNKAEKEAAKAELLEKGPYGSDELKALMGKEVKMLASAMGINSFGQAREDVEKAILAAQKKSPAKDTKKKK